MVRMLPNFTKCYQTFTKLTIFVSFPGSLGGPRDSDSSLGRNAAFSAKNLYLPIPLALYPVWRRAMGAGPLTPPLSTRQTEEAPDRHKKKLLTDRRRSSRQTEEVPDRQKKLTTHRRIKLPTQTEEAPDRHKKLTTDRRSSRSTQTEEAPDRQNKKLTTDRTSSRQTAEAPEPTPQVQSEEL